MAISTEKTSADIQREIDEDRQRIGDRIDAIQDRMSAGQLVDEVLSYAKRSGGGEYVSNLGEAVKANPLPVALIGVGLAWLMAKQGVATPGDRSTHHHEPYPLYTVDGPVRRLGPVELSAGDRYSHFSDDTGIRLKALTDESGRRAGHFVDEAGKSYRGFADRSGRRIEHIVDESGSALDAALGWASDGWDKIRHTATDARDRTSRFASGVAHSSSAAAGSIRDQTGAMNEAILKHFRDQPLVGGALAFAVGAAIGAALPSSDTEDRVFGDAADKVKDEAADRAASLADRGSEVASQVYTSAVSAASDIHDDIKERVVGEQDRQRDGSAYPDYKGG